jgi:hypothetical protein
MRRSKLSRLLSKEAVFHVVCASEDEFRNLFFTFRNFLHRDLRAI